MDDTVKTLIKKWQIKKLQAEFLLIKNLIHRGYFSLVNEAGSYVNGRLKYLCRSKCLHYIIRAHAPW